ncbi:glycerophosphodiester phosphodiesterase family protein [Streptomyces sp. NPDC014724]|uniref:glycerophosphodiester phosphodiesterase family protein n=1 Tax=unclassified Streptomyces TaxID=2593676 RepID=UPI003702EE2B
MIDRTAPAWAVAPSAIRTASPKTAVSPHHPTRRTTPSVPQPGEGERNDAHRGGAGESPENSVDALRAARAYSQVLDMDARLLTDGTLVSLHDAKIDRVINKSGTASTITAAQPAAARWTRPRGSRPGTRTWSCRPLRTTAGRGDIRSGRQGASYRSRSPLKRGQPQITCALTWG